jgi:hypothetical protein
MIIARIEKQHHLVFLTRLEALPGDIAFIYSFGNTYPRNPFQIE